MITNELAVINSLIVPLMFYLLVGTMLISYIMGRTGMIVKGNVLFLLLHWLVWPVLGMYWLGAASVR